MARSAELLGQPLMPWQRLVADVGLEFDPDSGLPAYREVVFTVPRQSGKTTLVLSWMVDRAVAWSDAPQRVMYTAQTGKDAREKLIDDMAPLVRRSELRRAVQNIFQGVGNEGIHFKGGSKIKVFGSSESAGHGKTLDLGVIDEAWSLEDNRREQSLIPAMSTRADAQLLIDSTAGEVWSTYFRRKVEAGRQSVLDGRTSGVAFFEWSADAGADPDDEDVWWSCMPALGHTITPAVVEHARLTMSDEEFRRAYLNQWPDVSGAGWSVIPEAAWLEVCDASVEPGGGLLFAVEVEPDRGSAAIAAADADGRVELIDHREGTGWLVERAAELAAKWATPVAVDEGGPAAAFIDRFEDAGVEVVRLGAKDVVRACGRFFDQVADRQVSVRSSDVLSEAVRVAERRPVNDQWVFSRRKSGGDVTPLMAAVLALFAAQGPERAPLVPLVGGW